MTYIDLLTIVPFYILYAAKGDFDYEFRFNILRAFRLFRIFRVYKYSSLFQMSIEVMLISVKKSSDALIALFLFIFIIIMVFSTEVLESRYIWT